MKINLTQEEIKHALQLYCNLMLNVPTEVADFKVGWETSKDGADRTYNIDIFTQMEDMTIMPKPRKEKKVSTLSQEDLDKVQHLLTLFATDPKGNLKQIDEELAQASESVRSRIQGNAVYQEVADKPDELTPPTPEEQAANLHLNLSGE